MCVKDGAETEGTGTGAAFKQSQEARRGIHFRFHPPVRFPPGQKLLTYSWVINATGGGQAGVLKAGCCCVNTVQAPVENGKDNQSMRSHLAEAEAGGCAVTHGVSGGTKATRPSRSYCRF